MRLSAIAAGFATAVTVVRAALPSISIKGSKFFDSNGNQWFVKGVAYQLVPADPLIDTKQCTLDAALMKTLGANAIRVYHVDPNGDHTGCMKAFDDAGIYLFVDLDTFNSAIYEEAPHWNQTQLIAFEKVMDEFQKFGNTAGFLVGNEVLTTGNGSVAAPYVKAAARDVKAYRNAKKYRNIPVGYSAADIGSLRPMLQNYLACGTNASEAIDFFSLNAYEWCGGSSYAVSGYSQLTNDVKNYNIPIFFSETGCNTVPPRDFSDQSAIFGPDMNPYWSGSIIYEWIQEENNYGIISYGPKVNPTAVGAPPDGFPRSGTPIPVSPDFTNLANQWKTLNPTGIQASAYSPTLTAPPCPAFTSGVWQVNGNVALPSLGATFDSAARSSITAGTAASSAPAATTTSAKKAGGIPAREVEGMAFGLAGVLIGFFWWL